jgi:hypothetical protein
VLTKKLENPEMSLAEYLQIYFTAELLSVFSSLIKVVMAGGRIGRQFCQPLCKAGRYSYSAPNSLFNIDLERSQEDATFELLKC